MATTLIPSALGAARHELARLRQLDAAGSLEAAALLPAVPAPAAGPLVVTVVQRVAVPSTAAAAAPAATTDAATSPAAATASAAEPPAAAPSPRASAGAAAASELPLSESERGELKRLDATIRELTETNDRIMAQNIALLADLEVAQRAVRELRAEKDVLALQLKRALAQ
jgi:hypothetical protein